MPAAPAGFFRPPCSSIFYPLLEGKPTIEDGGSRMEDRGWRFKAGRTGRMISSLPSILHPPSSLSHPARANRSDFLRRAAADDGELLELHHGAGDDLGFIT